MAEAPADGRGRVNLYPRSVLPIHLLVLRLSEEQHWRRCADPQLSAVLHEEIRLVAAQAPDALTVSDVHFGGGTPTLIPPSEFLALMEVLRRRFTFREGAAVAVEIDPRTAPFWPVRWMAWRRR